MAVTVVVPVLNRLSFLQETLDSIARGIGEKDRIIIVDNGSTDGSWDFCSEWVDAHIGVTLLKEPRKGVSFARNKGLRECQTEWIYFFDSDDVFESLPEIGGSKECDVVAFPTKMEVNGKVSVRAFGRGNFLVHHILTGMLSTQSMIFRTDFLRKIGGWNEHCAVWNDWELGARVLMSGARIVWSATPCHLIKVHGESLTGESFSVHHTERMKAIDTLFQEIGAWKGDGQMQAMEALYCRLAMLRGLLLREKNVDAADECRIYQRSRFRVSDVMKNFSSLLTYYTSHGGRGAWRMALWYIK